MSLKEFVIKEKKVPRVAAVVCDRETRRDALAVEMRRQMMVDGKCDIVQLTRDDSPTETLLALKADADAVVVKCPSLIKMPDWLRQIADVIVIAAGSSLAKREFAVPLPFRDAALRDSLKDVFDSVSSAGSNLVLLVHPEGAGVDVGQWLGVPLADLAVGAAAAIQIVSASKAAAKKAKKPKAPAAAAPSKSKKAAPRDEDEDEEAEEDMDEEALRALAKAAKSAKASKSKAHGGAGRAKRDSSEEEEDEADGDSFLASEGEDD